ncbi:primosomal replication protein N [Paucibacter sp. Y2R2-4]|uniref:primosomal replication protein N n=1 Tax=Paucibacter sp. Y2R2-4 TaxID=2893553 RepID=UPI0029624F71|nr:primosomal replication protein N [Paucibacter sp. Y2R2-4]
MGSSVNHLILQASVLELGLVRYTPAGLMALDCCLKHESQVQEAGRPRKVSMEIKAVAIGEIGKRLQALGVGGTACFSGFLSAQKAGRGTVFHITAIDTSQTPNCSNPD